MDKDIEIISLKKYGVENSAKDLREILDRWVAWEEKDYLRFEPTHLPRFEKVEVKRDSKWWLMFFKELLLDKGVNQFRP